MLESTLWGGAAKNSVVEVHTHTLAEQKCNIDVKFLGRLGAIFILLTVDGHN